MISPLPSERAEFFCKELIATLGSKKYCQMFGVLVCLDADGNEVILKAFSGLLDGKWNVPGFVPPLLDEDAFNKSIELSDKEIHDLTDKIQTLQKSIDDYVLALKSENANNPISGKNAPQRLKDQRKQLSKLKIERKCKSNISMHEIFDLYKIPCLVGMTTAFEENCVNPKNEKPFVKYIVKPKIEYKKLPDIFSRYYKDENKLPPTGAGECCAPKLFGYALANNLRPVSLAEIFYDPSNECRALDKPTDLKSDIACDKPTDLGASAGRRHLQFYPPCDEKCKPLLPTMLGIDVVYRDNYIVVINKQSGLLSVPGRGGEKQDCAVNRLKFYYPDCIEQPSVHRLDMETSGLLVFALTEQAHKNLSMQFMNSGVQKKYLAVLSKPISCGKNVSVTEFDENGNAVAGTIQAPFRLDVENRPHQIYDEVNGKIGTTEWRIVKPGENPIIKFTPHTGRTHQLRLHSSHSTCLNAPIIGDTLYGGQNQNQRLMLHAEYLAFTHPETQEQMVFEIPAEFNDC